MVLPVRKRLPEEERIASKELPNNAATEGCDGEATRVSGRFVASESGDVGLAI